MNGKEVGGRKERKEGWRKIRREDNRIDKRKDR